MGISYTRTITCDNCCEEEIEQVEAYDTEYDEEAWHKDDNRMLCHECYTDSRITKKVECCMTCRYSRYNEYANDTVDFFIHCTNFGFGVVLYSWCDEYEVKE